MPRFFSGLTLHNVVFSEDRFYEFPFVDAFVTEFSHLFLAITIIFVVAAAWHSTNTPDNWQVRAVYVFDRRFRRNRHVPRLTNHTISATLVESTTQPVAEPSTETDPVDGPITISTQTVAENKSTAGGSATNSIENGQTSAVCDERQEIIERMDADNDIVRQRRLAFFTNRADTATDVTNRAGSSTGASEKVTPSAPPMPREADGGIGFEPVQGGSFSGEPSAPPDANSIKIKLKYLNDDLKLVDARLSETLSAFKRRHFSTELSENKRIKLIFNGQLLQREEETLRRYGLFDNCVVHCLIHQSRTAQDDGTESGPRRTSRGRNERDWDLGNLLLVLVSILLSLAWYTRYNYPQLFSITSTVALVIITLLFAMISLGMFFPDQNVPNIEVHLR